MVMSKVETRPKVLAASTLKGNAVKNHHGEDLGTIEEFMIDLETGRVGYCVLSFGGVLGVGSKLFAVPFKAMKLNTADHTFRLEITKAKLNDAPGFNKDDWPDMTDKAWGNRIFGFYGMQPE